MMKILLFSCSQSVSVDQFTNRLSVFNLMETVSSAAFPARLSEVSVTVLATKLDDEPNVVELFLRCTCGGKEFARFPLPIDFQDKNRTRALITIGGVQIPSPDVFEIQLRQDRKKLASWFVDVIDTGKPEAKDLANQPAVNA